MSDLVSLQDIAKLEVAYDEGFLAWRNGKKFHECPYEHWTFEASAWRFGWNDKALDVYCRTVHVNFVLGHMIEEREANRYKNEAQF